MERRKRKRGREEGLAWVVDNLRGVGTTLHGVLDLCLGSLTRPGAAASYSEIKMRHFERADVESRARDQLVEIKAAVAKSFRKRAPVPNAYLDGAVLLAKASKGGEEGKKAGLRLRRYLIVTAWAAKTNVAEEANNQAQQKYDSFTSQHGPITSSIRDLSLKESSVAPKSQVQPGRGLFQTMSNARWGLAYHRTTVRAWTEIARIEAKLLGSHKAPSVGGTDMSPFGVISGRRDLLEAALFEWIILVGRRESGEYHKLCIRKGHRVLGRRARHLYYMFQGHGGVRVPKKYLVAQRPGEALYVVNCDTLNARLEGTDIAELFAPARLLSMMAFTIFVVALENQCTQAFVVAVANVARDLLEIHEMYARAGAGLLREDVIIWLVFLESLCVGDPTLAAVNIVGYFDSELGLYSDDAGEDESSTSGGEGAKDRAGPSASSV
jgi:hypothetical protein